MLPRLPNELPPPARASASPGKSANARAGIAARRIRVRDIRFASKWAPCSGALAIWCLPEVNARYSYARVR